MSDPLTPTLHFTVFTGPEKVGDYKWMISRLGDREAWNTVFIFPDNTSKCGNAGAACIRGHPSAVGIPTILAETPCMRAFKDVAEAVFHVEKAIDSSSIGCMTREGGHFYLPVDPTHTIKVDGVEIPVLGCGTFDVPLSVREYITARIYTKLKMDSRNGELNLERHF